MCRDEAFTGRPYGLAIEETCDVLQMDTRPLFRAIVEDISRGASAGEISQRFHDGLVEVFSKVAQILRERTSLNSVCLSGGAFQNTYLSAVLERKLNELGFHVFSHSQVPTGDGGISLGQAVVAAHRVE
jgi:hydrogenase maturation protein HypF